MPGGKGAVLIVRETSEQLKISGIVDVDIRARASGHEFDAAPEDIRKQYRLYAVQSESLEAALSISAAERVQSHSGQK